jgi:hypothetical protein
MEYDLQTLHDLEFDGLVQNMGIVEATRFWQLFHNGHGNWTEERHKVLEGLTLDDVVAEIMTKKGRAATMV